MPFDRPSRMCSDGQETQATSTGVCEHQTASYGTVGHAPQLERAQREYPNLARHSATAVSRWGTARAGCCDEFQCRVTVFALPCWPSVTLNRAVLASLGASGKPGTEQPRGWFRLLQDLVCSSRSRP